MWVGIGFSEKFLWGVSVSGFQFEMGDTVNKSVDANTDWYVWVHNTKNIRKGLVSGDLPENGVDYWSLYEKDHDLAKRLGLNAYRVGIEWSRIFLKSTTSIDVDVDVTSDGNFSRIDVDAKALEELGKLANKDALNHYRAMIEDLRMKSFKVFVCLNHFTLPLWFMIP